MTVRLKILITLLVLTMWSVPVLSQNYTTVPLNVTGGTTQIVAGTSGGYSINSMGFFVGTGAGSSQTTIQLVTGTVNGNACATSQATVTGPMTVGTGLASSSTYEIINGAPVIVVAGSVALCASVTGGTVNGWMTYFR